MIPIVTVNWLSVVIAAIAAIVIGSIWYSPKVFGTAWMKEMKIDPKKMNKAEMKKGMQKGMILMVIGSLVMASVLSIVLKSVGAVSLMDAVVVALWIAIGFYATMLLSTVAFEGTSTKLYLIKAFHYIVALIVMAAILVTWA
ncbi:MAG: DUF1761 domain-containing protein [Candidatus Micrarchaeota archaeon]|nr:DUF1761 domain-containing protein [Candidatus Micrarchaeota archaeon]